MSDNPYNENNLTVAQAKRYIASIGMDGIAAQIQHYQTTAQALDTLAHQIAAINTKLQATWSGEAADAANIQFGTVAQNASFMAELLSGQVVPALQNVHAAGQHAKTQIASVKDEVALSAPQQSVGKDAAAADAQSRSTLQQQTAFNTTQRRAAAEVMNLVANTYNDATATFSRIATSGQYASTTPTSSAGAAFNFGPAPMGAQSSSALNSYRPASETARPATMPIELAKDRGRTAVQGYDPPSATTPLSIGNMPLGAVIVPDLGNDIEPDFALGVFSEGGLSNGTRGEGSPVSTGRVGEMVRAQEGASALGGFAIHSPDEASAREVYGGEAEKLAHSTRRPGRNFGLEHYDTAPKVWENPAIGGREGILISQRSPVNSGITSAYKSALDEQGNPLYMLGGIPTGEVDSEDGGERRCRPDYLKEDPQWWQSERMHVPPVVD